MRFNKFIDGLTFRCFMKIDCSNYQVMSVKRQNPSFKAIHPSVYFIRCADGQFRRPTNPNVIKLLQRKIISWLNKPMNDTRRITDGKGLRVNKSETSLEKSMKERLVRFFMSNDKDYFTRREVRSVYITPIEGGKVSPYILTGSTVDMAGDGKSIGKIHGKIRESRDFIMDYYGATAEQARSYVSASDARSLSMAKADYHKQSEECVRKLMKDGTVDKSVMEFFFEPVITPKSKKVSKYNLVNVILKKYMIDPKV